MELNAQSFVEMVDNGIYRDDIKPLELAKYIAQKYCAFDDAELSLMDIYWDTAFNKGWLYVSPDMVENMFGYKAHSNMMNKFTTKLKNNFTENSEYMVLDPTNEMVIKFYSPVRENKDARGGSSKIHYAITGETFKCLTLMSGTITGMQTRKYYLKVEQLCMTTISAISSCIKIVSDREREINKKALDDATKKLELSAANSEATNKRMEKLQKFVSAARKLKKEEIFYIATSPLCAKNNTFKYGGVSSTKELVGRLAGYNTGHMVDDAFYFAKIYKCHKYRHIENCVEMLTKVFKDKDESRKEMLHIRFNCLVELVEFVIENDSKSIDYINEHGKRFLEETIGLDAIVPQPVSDITIEKKINKKNIGRINVADWSADQLRDAIKETVIDCARNKFGQDFDIEHNQEKINLTWAELATLLEIKYVGKNRTTWKGELKQIINNLRISVGWKK